MIYRDLLAGYKAKHGKLVEPRQGWDSLHRSLWLAYSMGRVRHFTDLGTYVSKPGDHGIGPPCYAFDLGRDDRFLFKGWGYLRARRLAKLYVAEHKALKINYVILGNRIWGPIKPKDPNDPPQPFWHPLTTGDTSHAFHIHVSGLP